MSHQTQLFWSDLSRSGQEKVLAHYGFEQVHETSFDYDTEPVFCIDVIIQEINDEDE